jgi:glutathione S-transferase
MSLVLYYGSGSPYAWRVWLALEHKGIAYEAKRLSFDSGDTKTPEFRAINPRGKVPVIVHDGRAIRESLVILDYLEEVWPTPPLMPASPHERARVRTLALEADEYLQPPLGRLVRQTLLKPEGDGDPAEIQKAKDEVAAELRSWEAELVGDWRLGAYLTFADFSLYPALRMIRRIGERMPQHNADALIGPGLVAWMGRIEALPYYPRTVPPHWKE